MALCLQHLRHVGKDVLIPKIMRGKVSGILMAVKCQKENSCKMEYLKEREEFRKTGLTTKKRLQKLPTSMQANIQMILRISNVHGNHNHLK
ncbi:hypothetical protein FD755_017879 [Muntiacus reevesi]|uniref:Uncharacterized protein n=2 Tax=Muntiacus TaxID=9885 RepID=A0A5N3XBX5_MUNRE|nr:hypothetical protein FD754_008215 [Muntiacus muntjak]KAB0369917.1 hypothetical protein FD755_017879 [Muntiacus reevesi]